SSRTLESTSTIESRWPTTSLRHRRQHDVRLVACKPHCVVVALLVELRAPLARVDRVVQLAVRTGRDVRRMQVTRIFRELVERDVSRDLVITTHHRHPRFPLPVV